MKLQKENGITLVALVVTIVVLLILAGVSINLVLGENGLITQAQEAKRKTAEAAKNDETDMAQLSKDLEDNIDIEETKPYLPSSDFKYVSGTSLENGLVIEDNENNQYVWIEVPRTLYRNDKYNNNKENRPLTSEDYSNIEYCLKQYTKDYSESKYEDLYVNDSINEGWFNSEAEYNDLKNKMLKSIYENGGFYIGRYETGIDSEKEENRFFPTGNDEYKKFYETIQKPVIKENSYPYTWLRRTQAQILARTMQSGDKESSLMFGLQWDLVLAFMHNKGNVSNEVLNNDSSEIGNYGYSEFIMNRGMYLIAKNYVFLSKTWEKYNVATENFVDSNSKKLKQTESGAGILTTTGASDKNCVMNIYDLAGNVVEWTLEKYEDKCVGRGARYPDPRYSARTRLKYDTDYCNFSIGFRVSIF